MRSPRYNRPLGLLWLLACGGLAYAQTGTWKFAVSGDSRNCGDIVMPAIAAGTHQDGAEFYWHLGDFRAIYKFDEDMLPPATLGLPPKTLYISDYLTRAWPDFIQHQIVPFGDLPVYLGIGNHETIAPATRERYLTQFADWLERPELRAQRLADNPQDHVLRTYYHWISRGVDFVVLDNASEEEFDRAQLMWLHGVLDRDEASAAIRTIVVGMHAALPGSFGYRHSMSDWAQGEQSGREVYQALWHAQNTAHKKVYAIASHSHFFMEDVFRTDYWKDRVVPGWIIGTAGAVRYRLPPGAAASGRKAMTDVYGYGLATVSPDGSVSIAFHQIGMDDLMKANRGKFPEALVRWCYEQNKQ